MALHICDEFLLRSVHVIIWFRLYLWTSLCRILKYFFAIFWRIVDRNQNKELIQRCRNDSKNLEKIPSHIAVQIYESDVSIQDASNILLWCISLGVKYVTLCDFEGFFKKNVPSLRHNLQKRITEVCSGSDDRLDFHLASHRKGEVSFKNTSEKSQFEEKLTKISVVSSLDGQRDIVDSARRICQDISEKRLRTEDINIPHLDQYINELNGYPDPELIIQFGMAESLLGFSPWKIRVTEILTLPTHHNIDYVSFLSVLQTYSRTQQRYGK